MEYWYTATSDVHEHVTSLVEAISEEQEDRTDGNLRHLRLYGNMDAAGLLSHQYSRATSRSNRHRVTLNIIQSMCDTLTAKIAKNQPKGTFLTSGGSWGMQQKAKLLDKFVEGQFYATGLYEIAPRAFLDACVFGTGAIKIYESDSEIKAERVFPNEILVDDQEAVHGDPRQLFQVKYINKDVLEAMFPEHVKAIRNAPRPEASKGYENATEQVVCIEAWPLPSTKDTGDGRHVICGDGATLLDEGYERSRFPFVFIRWTERLLGFYGQGLAEQLTGIQVEINKLLKNIQDQMHLAKPKVFVEAGSKISKAHINNETWGVVEYSGTPPQFYVPKTVSGEIFSHLDRLFSRAYEISGVSELAAQSKKPVGLESGVALREFQDIETERFMIVAQAYERLFIQAAEIMVDIAREVSERGESYEVITHGDKFIERIKWSEIDLKKDQYVMKIYPTSLLPSTPAAKLQKVIEMFQSGMLTQEETRRLLDYPDLEAINTLATAAQDDAHMLIDDMLNKGIYHTPEPYSDLTLGIKLTQSAYLRAKINKAPEKRLKLLRRFMQESMEIMAAMQQAAQGSMPGAPAEQAGPIDPSATPQMAPEMVGPGGPEQVEPPTEPLGPGAEVAMPAEPGLPM